MGIMAKRYVETDNSNGKVVTASNPTFAHIRGWNVGVRVVAANDNGTEWLVYLTTGSSGRGSGMVLLGTVRESDDGIDEPVFVPDARNVRNGKIFRFTGVE